MNSEPVCVCSCEDCGDFIVGLPEFISIFTVDDDIYVITRCPYCDRITKNECSFDMAEHLLESGAIIFNWNDGESFGI